MEQRYSVQQIKFELLSYLKEFGTHGPDWTIAVVAGPDDGLIKDITLNQNEDEIWICKPTLSAKAASIIAQHMVSRFDLNLLKSSSGSEDQSTEKNWVMMYRGAKQNVVA